MEDQIRRNSPGGAFEPRYPSTKARSGTRIEIESSDTTVSTTSANAANRYRKVPVMSNTDDLESNEDKMHTIISKKSANNIPAGAIKYNPSPGDMYTIKSQPKLVNPIETQGPDDDHSGPTSRSESRRIAGQDKQGDELREKLAEINAIGCMAAEGNPNAMSLLFKNVHSQNLIVRHEAIRSILLYGEKEDREQLHRDLPAGDWYIMDIRQEDMRKVC